MKLPDPVRRIQDRFFAAFGHVPAGRDALVREMLQPGTGDATGYWLQLGIAAILATLGLALNSTAVVIGAMLIAPLMRPLVELSMGLATGSATLALRALIRTVASIAVVIAIAFVATYLLPFHELTAELEARTAPSLLDLVVAGACALAAAYATLRAGADIATTAAGTSIGISLVPPLCAAGYGLALGDLAVARGAALLFTANLSGILAVATALFIGAGFGHVAIEDAPVGPSGRMPISAARIGAAWSRGAAKRLGPGARIVPPLVLLALVYVPLARAVGEIQHRGRVRQAVSDLLQSDKHRIVQYTLDHNASGVVVRAVVVGDARAVSELDRELRDRLARLDVDNPRLSIWAVPDAASVSALAHRVDEMPPPVTPEPATVTAHRYSSEVAKELRAVWPSSGVGAVVGISLDLDRPTHVRVTHLGDPLGVAGVQLLIHALEPTAGQLEIDEDALQPVEAAAADGMRWLPSAFDLVRRTRRVKDLHLCVTLAQPPVSRRGAAPSEIAFVRDTFKQVVEGTGFAVSDGDRWQIVAQREPCASPTTP